MVATLAFIGVVALSTIDPHEVIHTGSFDVAAGGFRDPLAGGVVSLHLAEEGGEAEGETSAGQGAGITAFAAALLLLGLIGWSIEAALSAAVVGFIARVRPDVIGWRPADAASLAGEANPVSATE
jgi:hypothetical protein